MNPRIHFPVGMDTIGYTAISGGVEYSSFPSGCEEHVRVIWPADVYGRSDVLMNVRMRSSADIMRMLMVTDALRRDGAKSIQAYIPYLPYARQDRVCNKGEALSAKVMADLINSQNYDAVLCCDPHSDVMPALINNCITIMPVSHLMRAIADNPGAILCSPDAGAIKRVAKLSAMVGHDGEIVTALKSRVMGGVSVTSINGDVAGKTVIVVDDICDGGGSFMALAPLLKDRGASKVVLCVTHGLFTKGVNALLSGGIDHVYCTNSCKKFDHEKVTTTKAWL